MNSDSSPIESDHVSRPDISELKMEVNEFLYGRLPDGTTLKEMEDVASKVYGLISAEWDKFC